MKRSVITLSFSIWHVIRVVATVSAIMVVSVGVAFSADALPYWLNASQGMGSGGKHVSAGRVLIGRSFVFTSSSPQPEPRYGRLTILTFEERALRELRPMITATHTIRYDREFFAFPDYLASDQFGIDDLDGGILRLYRISGPQANVEYTVIGLLQEVEGKTKTDVTALIAGAEKAEIAQRQTELRAAGGGPHSYIDLHNSLNGDLIEDVYYGRLSGATTARGGLTDDRWRIKAMFLTYHELYGERYADDTIARGEPMTRIQSQAVIRNWYGTIVQSWAPVTRAIVRDRYLAEFTQARDAEGQLGLKFATDLLAGRKTDLQRYNYAAGMRDFLDQNYTSSSETVKRLEQNLERYLNGQAPLTITGASARTMATYAARADWHPAGEEQLVSVQGLSWAKPKNWNQTRTLGRSLANYDSNDLSANFTVELRSPAVDPLQWVNMYLDLEQRSPLRTLDDPAVEAFTIEGRTGHLLVLKRRALAVVDDGSRSLIVFMFGPAVVHGDGFRKFVQSFKWAAPK